MSYLEKQLEELGYKVNRRGNDYSIRKIGENTPERISGNNQLRNKVKEIQNKNLVDDILRNGGF